MNINIMFDIILSYFNAILESIYLSLFKVPQYPFFTLIQMIWCVYQVRILYFDQKRKEIKILSILKAILAIFLPRYIVSVFYRIQSPLSRSPQQIYSFLLILCIFYLTPHNLTMKILSNRIVFFILAFLQGVNETRFLKMGYHYSKPSNGQVVYLVFIIFLSSVPYLLYSYTSIFSFSIYFLICILYYVFRSYPEFSEFISAPYGPLLFSLIFSLFFNFMQ